MKASSIIVVVIAVAILGVGVYYYVSVRTVNSLEVEIIETSLVEDQQYLKNKQSALDGIDEVRVLLNQYKELYGKNSILYKSVEDNLQEWLVWLEEVEDSKNFIVEITIKVVNQGGLDVILNEREVTLYINDMNIGTKGFEESWDKIPSQYYVPYTATWAPTDSEKSSTLFKSSSYNIRVKFKASIKAGLYASFMEKTHTITWRP